MHYFGTDGVRGPVGVAPMTPDGILKLGYAVGRILGQEGRRLAIVGKDTRLSGYLFESALEAGLSAAGVTIGLLGPLPTPGIAYLTRALQADVGIVISASHNPYTDNGIKFFSSEGKKLSDELESKIEAALDDPIRCVASKSLGKAYRVPDASGRYIEFCKSKFHWFKGIKNIKGLKVVLDCAHGAAYRVAPLILQELGAEVVVIHASPDGLNINKASGVMDTRLLSAKVLEVGADLGIALDGDADRVYVVDEKGNVHDGDAILFLLIGAYKARHRLSAGVVGTLMTNMALEQYCEREGLDFVRVAVGDRYVRAALEIKGWFLGGESSGHLICLDAHTTGDGMVTALRLLSYLQYRRKALSELLVGYVPYPRKLVNVPVQRPTAWRESQAFSSCVASVEKQLQGVGRVLVRPSGTEPVLRILVEAESPDSVEAVTSRMQEAALTYLGVA